MFGNQIPISEGSGARLVPLEPLELLAFEARLATWLLRQEAHNLAALAAPCLQTAGGGMEALDMVRPSNVGAWGLEFLLLLLYYSQA